VVNYVFLAMGKTALEVFSLSSPLSGGFMGKAHGQKDRR